MSLFAMPDRHTWHAASDQSVLQDRKHALKEKAAQGALSALEGEELHHLDSALNDIASGKPQSTPTTYPLAADGLTAALLASYVASDAVFVALNANQQWAQSTLLSWQSAQAVNFDDVLPSVQALPLQGGLESGAIQSAVADKKRVTIVANSDRLLELTPLLFSMTSQQSSAVILAPLVSKQADGSFTYGLDKLSALRNLNIPILYASNAQECYHLSVVAHLLAINFRLPVIVAFDGIALPSRVEAFEAFSTSSWHSMMSGYVRATGLSVEIPEGEAVAAEHVQALVSASLSFIGNLAHHKYKPFEVSGAAQETVFVAFGPLAAPLAAATSAGHCVLSVRQLRSWDTASFVRALPKETKTIVVLDAADVGGEGSSNALYLDVATSIAGSSRSATLSAVSVIMSHDQVSVSAAQQLLSQLAQAPNTPSVTLKSTSEPQTHADVVRVDIMETVVDESATLDRAVLTASLLSSVCKVQTASLVRADVTSASQALVTTTLAGPSASSYASEDIQSSVIIVLDTSLLFLQPAVLLRQLKDGGVLLINASWQHDELEFELPSAVAGIVERKHVKVCLIDLEAAVHEDDSSSDVIQLLTQAFVANAACSLLLPSVAPLFSKALARALHQQTTYDATAIIALSSALEAKDAPRLSTKSGQAAVGKHVQAQGTLLPYSLAASDDSAPNHGDVIYRKLLSTLFGERMVLADSSASNSLTNEKYVHTKSALDMDAIFGDKTEYTLGIFLARLQQRQVLTQKVGAALTSNADMPSALRQALDRWFGSPDDPNNADISATIIRLLEPIHESSSQLADIWHAREHFATPSRWILGNSDWARDIGFSGIHHVIASRKNINVIVPETELYSTPRPELRTVGKTKKDIGLYAMSYGNVYVGSIAAHASYKQAVQTLLEADAFPGPSIIVAYAPSPNLANPRELASEQKRESKLAVDQGYWPLFRWNPAAESAGRDPFTLDSLKLRKDLKDFLKRESELSLLGEAAPKLAAEIQDSAAQRVAGLHDRILAGARKNGRQLDVQLLVLYGSDSGNGSSLAEKLAKKAEMRGVSTIRCCEANAVSLEDLAQEQNVIMIMSTAGQGEFCGNSNNFWGALKKAKTDLSHLSFAVFGLGDSAYWGKGTADSARYYCKPAKDLDARLGELGAARLTDIGFGDDQHENGYSGTWQPWHEDVLALFGATPLEGEEEITGKVLKDESIKEESGYLRGHIQRSLDDKSTQAMLPEDTKLTKFHGIYQQDDRDLRAGLEEAGKERAYSFMVRVGIPGGVCTSEQYLVMDALSDSHANGTLKLTTRQAYQLHGVLKWNLKDSIKGINRALMDTLAACGDVCRNVMANPNPYQSEVHGEVIDFARRLSTHLKPQTTAYQEIWLDKKLVAGQGHVDVEPLYGAGYLPRKFKVAIAVPPMNDVDVFAHCLGYIAVVDNGKLLGWNVSIGGGMGMTHGNTKTYPRLADLLGFCTPEQAIMVGEAVMIVQRDHGDRVNRKHARLKYTLEDHGMAWYREKVEAYCGFKLQEARPFKFEDNNDRYGWTKGVDGNYHYGMFIENGRIQDTDKLKLKTALRELAQMHTGDFRLTANQNLIVGSITPDQRPAVEQLFQKYGIGNERNTGLRLSSMACVAMPTCGLAMAESERYLPKLIDKIDAMLTRNNLESDSIVIRMSGCPNGCSRPYVAEIAMVGKAPGSYNLYLGGGHAGNRLAKIHAEAVNEEQILAILEPLVAQYAKERLTGEHFGDFVIRKEVVAPTLAGRLFHETDAAVNKIETHSGTTQIYW